MKTIIVDSCAHWATNDPVRKEEAMKIGKKLERGLILVEMTVALALVSMLALFIR